MLYPNGFRLLFLRELVKQFYLVHDIDFLRKIMDEISDRTTVRGLTPEILESIINEP
jgi:hypothetical protein